MNIISIDLHEAARRSDQLADWDEHRVTTAITRYEHFFRLCAAHPGVAMAPTRDIDEVWHLHMLSPRAYYNDCMALFGHIFDHDGGFGKGEGEREQLGLVFTRTARMWQEAYGEPYITLDVGACDCTSADHGDACEAVRKCWHDCQGRCWHACKSVSA